MKNLNLFKIANVLTLVVTVLLALSPFAVSAQFNTGNLGNLANNAGVATQGNFSAIAVQVINILLGVVGLVAVIFLIIGGFRYVTAGGNEEAAESGKKTITNAIIGIVI